jgi:hypothetical protein
LAETYGIPVARAEEALAADAPHPSVASQEKRADPAEARPEPTAPEDAGPRATSSQLATIHCLSRDQMEAELVRLGLRGPADDGATLYSVAGVARRLAEEDDSRFAAAAELLVNFTADSGLAAKIVEEVIGEAVERWIAENNLHAEIADLQKTLLIRFKKTHCYQMAKRSGDSWGELAALQEFGAALVVAASAAQPKAEGDTTDV